MFIANFFIGLKIWDEIWVGGPLFLKLPLVGKLYFCSKSMFSYEEKHNLRFNYFTGTTKSSMGQWPVMVRKYYVQYVNISCLKIMATKWSNDWIVEDIRACTTCTRRGGHPTRYCYLSAIDSEWFCYKNGHVSIHPASIRWREPPQNLWLPWGWQHLSH